MTDIFIEITEITEMIGMPEILPELTKINWNDWYIDKNDWNNNYKDKKKKHKIYNWDD